MIELAGKTYRERVEVLVFRNDTVYIVETKDGYLLPGGSTEPNKSLEEQAIAEVKEECRFIISDLQYVDTHYVQFDSARKKKNARAHPDFPVRYDGECNHIFTAQYKSGYAGIILSKDTDPEMLYGHWVKFKDAKRILRPEHIGLIPSDNNAITNLQPAEESLITPVVVEIPGRKDYRFEKTHVLMVSTNDPSNNLLKEVYDIKAIEDRMAKAGMKQITILDVDEFITYYCGGRGALKNDRTILEVAERLREIFHDKKVKHSRVDIFKRFPEMLAEFTKQNPKHGIILNIIPMAYGLLPYDCYQIDMGSINRIRAGIKEGIYDYRRGNTFHHMMDPNLKNKGVLVQNPEKLELYHVSTNLDLTSLTPNPTRSPMLGEMVVIPRVSAAPTVDKCFGAIYKRYHNVYAVYKLLPTKTTRIFRPGENAVPDVKKSGEVWVLDPVKVKKIDEVIITYIKNKVFTIKTDKDHGEVEIDTTGQIFRYGIDCSAPMVKPPFIMIKLCPKDNPTEIASYAKIDCETEYVWISTKKKYKRISAELEKALKEYIHDNFT